MPQYDVEVVQVTRVRRIYTTHAHTKEQAEKVVQYMAEQKHVPNRTICETHEEVQSREVYERRVDKP